MYVLEVYFSRVYPGKPFFALFIKALQVSFWMHRVIIQSISLMWVYGKLKIHIYLQQRKHIM